MSGGAGWQAPVDWARSVIAPAAAALATICAATALTGVIKGWSWLGYITVAVVLISCTGLALRSIRVPTFLVGIAQLTVLLLLVTGLFTSSGILAVIPGPAAFGELGQVLSAAGDSIRTGLPPVAAEPPILCLATIGIGMVAIIVDALAVAIAAPAAAGLVLLCLYAVPASLADEMLPWWTFTIGAAAFAGLIAVDGSHRHRLWRGRRPPVGHSPAAASTPAVVIASAVTFGLLAGASLTAIGTVGQLPFDEDKKRSYTGGLGLKPFTELRGLLNDQGDTEVFRVRGLGDEKRLLRAFTLDTFEADKGWRLPERMPHGVEADRRPLPRADGDENGDASTVNIRPVNWRDVWLPTYGSIREIRGVDDTWFYDKTSGSVYRERAKRPPPYTLTTSLDQPESKDLRQAEADPRRVPAVYTELPSIDPRVRELTGEIVQGKTTAFEKASALWKYFISDGNFTYDTRTAAAADDDALADFLLNGKRGYCAQFASAMAVMLRAENIPARVAIGFTQGEQKVDHRSISTKDAHAWVEVYFGEEHGWVSFDPTPLDGGRGFVPPYLEDDGGSDSDSDDADSSAEESAEPTQERDPEGVEAQDPEDVVAPRAPLAQAPGWARWSTLFLVVIAGGMTGGALLVARRASDMRTQPLSEETDEARRRLATARRWLPTATVAGWLLSIGLLGWMVSWWLAIALLIIASVAAGPALLREISRGHRLHDITLHRPSAPYAAWRELLDECADRGTPVQEAETARQTARQLAEQYDLDDEGRQHLRTVVRLLERSWYSPDDTVEAEFAVAFEKLRRSLHQNAPLSWRDRFLPISVTRKFRR